MSGDGNRDSSSHPVAIDRRTALQQSLFGGLVLAAAGAAGEAAAQPVDGGTVRQIVTGNNARGKSYFVKDEVVKRGPVWSNSPADVLGPGGPGDPKTYLPTSVPSLDPPPGGTKWEFFSIPPSKKKKGEPLDKTLGNGAVGKDGFHRTATIDYVLIKGGDITIVLDEGETELHDGDLVVQRNTSHAWQNYGTKPVTLLAVMVRI